MMTAPDTPSDLFKTAGQRCALRDLGLISQDAFEKDAWIPAAIGIASAVGPALWKGVKGLFSKGKAAAGAASAAGATSQIGRGTQSAMRGWPGAQMTPFG